MTLQTPVCDLFGVEFPIFSAGMGIGAGAALAAAVSNAGGCDIKPAAEVVRDTITEAERVTRQTRYWLRETPARS